ncbi:MAG TPA: L-rhamnose mutarotase [Arachidicoccus sp.]|nr:L-rhamnose mutarotase [Arachidicoccus sp.]
MKRQCYALDLINDPDLIAEYEFWHKAGNGWPEIRKSIIGAGVIDMQIYRTGNRLFMIIETEDSFCYEEKVALDAANPKVQEWERLMWKFQKPLPWASSNEKWVLMDQIFGLWQIKT